MNPVRYAGLKVFRKQLAETGPAATIPRLCTSKHLGDLQLIAFAAAVLFVAAATLLAITYSRVLRGPPTSASVSTADDLLKVAALFTALVGAAGAVLNWAYQTGSRRLGAIDLFACEISAICRVCLVVNFAQTSVDRAQSAQKQPHASISKFTSEEHYTPVYDNNLSDIEPLDVDAVTFVTEFYTYRKTMMDYIRAMYATVDEQQLYDLQCQMIYMQFLMYESGRRAVDELIEFEPNNAESKINILCSEMVAYQFLASIYTVDYRSERLKLRKVEYRQIVPDLLSLVERNFEAEKRAQRKNWERARSTAPELQARYKQLCSRLNMDAGLSADLARAATAR